MDNEKKDVHKDGFFRFVLKYVGIIAAVLAVGLSIAFSNGNTAMLVFTLLIALLFFLILMKQWDAYRCGALFTLTAVCINIEHISRFRTDYVFETIPEDETKEPQIFILAEKRTKFKKYMQGVPYTMIFGMQKYSRELITENLVTASKRTETYGDEVQYKGFIDLDTLGDDGIPNQDTQSGVIEDHKGNVALDADTGEEHTWPSEKEGDAP